jgi:arylsulfatase A-like enzyme
VVHSVQLAGYETVAFVPERPVTIEEDELRYAALGFAEHEVPPSAFDRPEGQLLDNSLRGWVRTRDRESFDALKKRVAASIEQDQRFLYSFNPQLTHGPWPGITETSSREETCRAGFPLFTELDGMVGELRTVLKEKGRLDKTLIVVLGDHGLRTRREYPPFHAGTLDDVTFHVPLVLYAPGVVESTVRIPWMTSHIDIAPSVLDLLGIQEDRDLELGSPMWDPALADRTTFFFARSYLGADGYQRSNEAVMVRYLYGGVLRAEWNGTLRFRATDAISRADGRVLHPVDDLTMMAAIQAELARTLLPTVGQLARVKQVKRVSTGEARVVPRDSLSRVPRSPQR